MSHGLKLLDTEFIDRRLREPTAKKSRLESYFLGVMEFVEAPPSPSLSDTSTSPFHSWSHEMKRGLNQDPPSPSTSNPSSQGRQHGGISASSAAKRHAHHKSTRQVLKMRARQPMNSRKTPGARKMDRTQTHKAMKARPSHSMETRSRSRIAARFSQRIASVGSWEKD